MSVQAYSEPYAQNRRLARAFVRQREKSKQNKSADVIPLTPRVVTLAKPIEVVYPKYRKLSSSLLVAAVVGFHLLVFGYFYYQPIVEAVKKVEIPKIKIERYIPPVIPPQVVETTKTVKHEQPKQEQPKPVRDDNPNIIEKYVPPAPLAEAAAPIAEKVTQASAYANYLHNPPPPYPEIAQERGWEGTVLLSVLVQPDGKPKVVEVKTSSGKKLLDQTALQWIQQHWAFVPARRGETAVEGWVEVPIDFHIGS